MLLYYDLPLYWVHVYHILYSNKKIVPGENELSYDSRPLPVLI